jgi:serine phosphatase RsbU (regulator of sigma subunit)
MAMVYFEQALDRALILRNEKIEANCYSYIGDKYRLEVNHPRAFEYYNKALKISEPRNLYRISSFCYSSMGAIYQSQGDFEKSLDNNFKALSMAEKMNNKQRMAFCYNNIGTNYYYQKDFNNALKYFEKSNTTAMEIDYLHIIAFNYEYMGEIYRMQDNYAPALKYYNKALEMAKKINDPNRIAAENSKIGAVYLDQGDYDKAIEYLNEAIKIAEKVRDLTVQTNSFIHLGMVYLKLNRPQKAIEIALRVMEFAKSNGESMAIKNAAGVLEKAYWETGDKGKAYEMLKLYKQMSDSLGNEENQKRIVSLEFQRKEEKMKAEQIQKDAANRTEQIRKEEALRKQRIIIYSFVGGFLLILIFSVLLYREYKAKKKANIVLAQQNVEIRQQKEEISAQRDEIEAQRDLVTRQKNHIEEIHGELKDSIRYAQRIQHAVLPKMDSVGQHLGEHFIVFKPRDIVSGDFYWFERLRGKIMIAVADCTGHGVPGAFMSMLGLSYLNEIVAKGIAVTAAGVLDEMRKNIIAALQQQGTSGEQKDGMDMTFIILDPDQGVLQFAGANNSVYMVRGSDESGRELNAENRELTEIRPDKMPVAIHEFMTPFTNHEIPVHKGDIIYLLTDGYADQFGGPKGKKFKYAQLEKLLLGNCCQPMSVQGDQLSKVIEEWKTGCGVSYDQTDDITVMGIRIS